MKHFNDIKKHSDFYNLDVKHPFIDIQRYEDANDKKLIKNEPICYDFYKISFVKNFNGYIQIDSTKFSGENGILHFVKPGQIYTCNSTNPWEGYQILIHPDIFKSHFAYKKISTYDFFAYEANESLLLTSEEEQMVSKIMDLAWQEFHNLNDEFSIPIILSHISTLLHLSERFYNRQFSTRKILGNQLSNKFFVLLEEYYSNSNPANIRQPSVHYFAEKLNVTANYLSDTIRQHTGEPALAIIHDFIIKEAKKLLIHTELTVTQISYNLGFEYPNYFSRLFKQKTNYTPSKYRQSVKSI